MDQRIFFGFTVSLAGILLLLKLVTIPPNTINVGKIQGVLKKIKINKKLHINKIKVIILLIEILKAFKPA